MNENNKSWAPESPLYRKKGVSVMPRGFGLGDIVLPGRVVAEWANNAHSLTIGRREALEKIVNVAAGVGWIALLSPVVGKAKTEAGKGLSADVHYRKEFIDKAEVVFVRFLKGPQQNLKDDPVAVFAKDMANDATSDKISDANFTVKNVATWSEKSRLANYFLGLDQFVKDMVLKGDSGKKLGRDYLKANINSYSNSPDAVLVDKFETFLTSRGLPVNTDEAMLYKFFTLAKSEGGLGYSTTSMDLVFDGLRLFRSKQLTDGYIDRVNKMNETSGTSARMPK